ncbi:MAG: hypothetical protein E2O68_00810 [Deltaproteobacteria bacterium]|nr:MAG: hypothetical protein E2O68_00810 [Deltaproteobacteria bacterium]
MNLAKLLIIPLLLFSFRAHSFYTEVGASYSFQREVYGSDYQSKVNQNTAIASLAFYFFSLTGLELSYSWNKLDNLDKTLGRLENDSYLTGNRRILNFQEFGIGVTQYFNSTKALLRPGLGLGFTRRLTKESGYYDVYNDLSGKTTRYDKDTVNTSSNLMYVWVSLKFRIIEGLYLSGSVRTLFAPEKYKEAQNNLKFLVGFSWLF